MRIYSSKYWVRDKKKFDIKILFQILNWRKKNYIYLKIIKFDLIHINKN